MIGIILLLHAAACNNNRGNKPLEIVDDVVKIHKPQHCISKEQLRREKKFNDTLKQFEKHAKKEFRLNDVCDTFSKWINTLHLTHGYKNKLLELCAEKGYKYE